MEFQDKFSNVLLILYAHIIAKMIMYLADAIRADGSHQQK